MMQLLSVVVLFFFAFSALWDKSFWTTPVTAAVMLVIARVAVPFQSMGIVWVWYLCVAIFGAAFFFQPHFQTWREQRKHRKYLQAPAG